MDLSTYALMYLELNVVSVLLVCVIRYKSNGLSQMVAQRNFVMAIDAQVAFFASDTLARLMYYGFLPSSPYMVIFLKSVYFFSTALMCYFWFVYFEYMQESDFVKSRTRVRVASILVWVMAIMLLINVKVGMFFFIDEDGIYTRGPWFILQYILSYAYVFFTCTRAFIGIFDKRKIAKRKLLIELAIFPVVPAIAGIIQFVKPELPLACVSLSLATLILYLNWIDQVISLDPLTKLNNRKRFVYFYDQWQMTHDEKEDLYLMMIDANKFKSINDTYGHAAGDMALVRIAEALNRSCRFTNKRSHIARYGGDEFAVFICGADPELMDSIKEKISESLKELNDADKAPYELSVSMGYTKVTYRQPLKNAIEMADKNLYEDKERFHANEQKPTLDS